MSNERGGERPDRAHPGDAQPLHTHSDRWAVIVVAIAVAIAVAAAGPIVSGLAIVIAILVVLGAAIRRGVDATAALTVYLVTLFCLPAYQVVPPLKAAGAPALLIGLGLMGWWMASRLTPTLGGDRGLQPLRIVLMLYLAAMLACYGMGFREALSEVQQSSANRVLLAAFSVVGVALFTADGVASLERLRDLVRRVVIGAGYVAFVSILQFQGIADLATIVLPGLTLNNAAGTSDRSGFSRVIGTTNHAIEAGVIFGIAFPLALHLLVAGCDRRDRRIGGIVAVLLAVAVPMTVSRTAPLILAVGLLVLVPTWTGALRRRALVVGACGLVAMRIAFPGLLGTVRALFTYAGEDPSISGRTDDYTTIFELFDNSPVFGIGPGTFLPESYFYLDNQFLFTAVEMGTIGLVTLVILVVTGVALAVGARRATTDPQLRDLAQALMAAFVAGLVSFATFDAFSFPMFTALWFLILGLIGALWRFVVRTPDEDVGEPRRGEHNMAT